MSFQHIPRFKRRLLAIAAGNVVMGLAVTLLRLSLFGNDPFSCMNLGYSLFSSLPFSVCIILCNCVLILVVLVLDRSYIHIGTAFNMFVVGITSDFFYAWMQPLFSGPSMGLRISLMIAGILISCYGCSAYVCANLGMGPYDAIGWIAETRLQGRIPFRYLRIGLDTIAVTIGFWLGSIVGAGTLVMALFTGPLISFFNEHLNMPLLYGSKGEGLAVSGTKTDR